SPRLAGVPGGADRGPAADPARAQGQARRPADDGADGGGPRDRGEALRAPVVRRGGSRLGEARESARRLRADPGLPQGERPGRAAGVGPRMASAMVAATPTPMST